MIQQAITIGSGGGYMVYSPTAVYSTSNKSIVLSGVTEIPHCVLYVQGNYRAVLVIGENSSYGKVGQIIYSNATPYVGTMTYAYDETTSQLTLTATVTTYSNFNSATAESFTIF